MNETAIRIKHVNSIADEIKYSERRMHEMSEAFDSLIGKLLNSSGPFVFSGSRYVCNVLKGYLPDQIYFQGDPTGLGDDDLMEVVVAKDLQDYNAYKALEIDNAI